MSAISTGILAFSMSADAFAVAVSKGVCTPHPRVRDAIKTGAIFGIIEGITPIIGWVAGLAASRYIQAIDHWIAFVILGIVGGKLLYEAIFPGAEEVCETPAKSGIGLTILTAIGTSIDALAVGVTLAFLPVNIWLTAAAIGTATFIMATLGILLGHYIGTKAGRWAEALGGLALIGIGTHILLTHLGML